MPKPKTASRTVDKDLGPMTAFFLTIEEVPFTCLSTKDADITVFQYPADIDQNKIVRAVNHAEHWIRGEGRDQEWPYNQTIVRDEPRDY